MHKDFDLDFVRPLKIASRDTTAGSEFIDENGGVGVRLKKPARTTPTKK